MALLQAPNVNFPAMKLNFSTFSAKPFTVQICVRCKWSYETSCALRPDGRRL
jgi:hypothetical protein